MLWPATLRSESVAPDAEMTSCGPESGELTQACLCSAFAQKLDLRSLLAAPDSDDEFKHLLPPPIDLSDVNTQGGGARDDARAAGGERRVQ
eukprot:778071-Rhodomonas_salina.3